ncbi:hypothetical protein GF420_12420 [candidate division GN15 bacterium]|nr:hypothetical protein [candidate division GN15 bacterium]
MIGLGAIGLIALVAVGCGDDDENGPTGSSLRAVLMMQGFVAINPDLEYCIELWDVTASGRHPDSLNISDSIATTYFDSWYWTPQDNYWASCDYGTDVVGLASGDTVEVTTYMGTAMVTTPIRLLHRSNDRPSIVSPPANDTVATGESITYVWDRVPNADFYGFSYRYYHDSAGLNVYSYQYETTTDTSFTIPGALTPDNGNYYLSVSAYTGPRPVSGAATPNVNGAGIQGTVWSYSYSGSRTVFVGSGIPGGAISKVGDPAPDDPRVVLSRAAGVIPQNVQSTR